MLFTRLFRSCPCRFPVFPPFACSCMSNYRKIYAFSDQLICSLSNDFYTFCLCRDLFRKKRGIFLSGDKKNWAKIDVVRELFAAGRTMNKESILIDRLTLHWMDVDEKLCKLSQQIVNRPTRLQLTLMHVRRVIKFPVFTAPS
jgi:hypothetical protein